MLQSWPFTKTTPLLFALSVKRPSEPGTQPSTAFMKSTNSPLVASSTLSYARPNGWVYAKRPFAGPEQVLDYVGRYTHRVAICNNRLLDIPEGKVTFRYKDYRHDAQQKTMTLQAEEFIRRFLYMCF